MELRTEMGSSYSTYLEQNCAPDLFHIVVWPRDLIKYQKIRKTYHAACNTSELLVEKAKQLATEAPTPQNQKQLQFRSEKSKELATGASYVEWKSTIFSSP